MPDPSVISFGVPFGDVRNFVDNKGNLLHFDQTDLTNGRLEQGGWTTETNFWRDENGNEYIYDQLKSQGRGDEGFVETIEREKGVKLTKAGANERPSNYLEEALLYAMPDGSKTAVRLSDKEAFVNKVKKDFQRDPSKVWDGSVDDLEAFGVNPLTTRRINGVFLAVTDRTSSAIDDMARANGGTITAQMMAEAGFTPSQLMEGQKWMTGKLKQNEEAFKNKYGPMGFREYEEKVRATSMGGDSLGRTYARQALQQMPKSIGVKSFDEQVRDYGADNGLQLLKERTWIGKALDAIGYGGLAHKETWDWMFMSDEEQYEVFKTLNEELKRNEYEAEVRDNTWQASVGSGAIDMGLYALDMMPAAVFSTATGTGLKGGLGAYTGTHIRGKATEQKANKMAYDPLTGGMISIAPGREGWSAWLYGGANAALDYGIEHGGGKLLGALEKKIIGMPMRKLTQRVLGRETAIVMGLAPGVINPSKMGLAARLSSKAQRGFLKVFGSDSWLSGLQKATGIRLLSPSGFLEELNEEITQNSIVGLLNLDGTAVDEQGRLRALSLGNAAKAIVETVKASPEMFGQMALYSLGVGPLTRGTHMLTGAYGSKAALKQGLKALGMTDEQLKGMSRADLKKAFEERLSAQDKGIYQADLDAVMDEMDGKSNAELIGELAKQGWNMTLSEDGQTLEYIDPEQSQKQEAERVEAEAQREETTSDIQLYDEGFAQAQQAKQNTTTIRGEAAIKEHLLGIIEQSLKRDGIRAYHTAKQSYDIGVALTQMTRRELKDVKRHLFNNDLDAAFGFIGNRDVYDTLVESMAVDYLAKSGRYKGTLAERVLRQYAEQLKGQAIIEAEETGWTRDKADDVRETIAAFNRYFMGNTLEDVDISGEKPARAFTESDNELKAAGQHTTEDGVVFTSTGDGSYTVYYQGNLNDYSVVGIAGFSYAMPVFAETMRNEFSSYDEALAYANELNAKVKKFKSERDELGKFAQDVARRTLGLTPDEDSGMTFINSVFDDRDIFNEVYGLVLNKMGGDHAKAMQFIGSVRGVRLSDGRTVVFLNNISSRSELVLTIRHELTHKGSNASGLTFRDDWGLSSELVKGLKGAELNKVLKEVFEAAGVPFIGTLGERVQNFDKLDEAEKVRVLDETLAAVAEILDDKPGLAGRISNRLWGLFSKKTGLKDLTAAQILEEVRNITSDTFARARLDIRQGKKGTRANVRDYAGDIRTAAALGAIAEDEAIENEAEAKRQQMKATIDELNRQESEARAQEEEAERRRGGRGRRRRGRKHEPAGETVEGDIDRIRMDENAPQQPTPEQPEPEDAEYDFKSTRQQEMERKQAEAMDGGSRYGTVVMPEIQPEPSRMIADKPDEEKAAEEAERIRLHNRRVDAYVKYLYRHRGEPLPSRYGVIQIWPEDVLKLPPPPADPAERLDPKAKKDWNWAEHLATLAYRQEQEYQRLKTDPQALTEDKLKAAMNAFKLYKSASMYAEKSGMTEAVKRLNAAFWRMEHEIERNFLEPEARRKVNQKKHSKDIKALQKSFDEAMDNAKPRLEDDERSRVWNRIVLDYLMFKAEAAFAEALTKGLKKVGKKKWNAFRGPIINAVRKLANDAASPEGWLAKRLENPSVADADAIKAFIAEAFGLEPDAIPMGWTSMMDELAVAMEEMTKGIRGYLDWSGPAPTLDLARPTAAGISMEDASHLTEMMRTPAQPREEAQPEPTPEPTPVEQEPIPDPTPEPTPEQPVEQKPAQPKSEWEEREDLDADLEEPFDADETEGAWRPRAYGKPGMENANGEVAYDWKEEGGLLVAEEDGETISGGRKNFQDEADEALGNIAEALPSVEGNVVYLQTGPLEPGKAPTKLVVFGESAQTIAGALDAANVTYRDNFDSIDEKIDEGKETRDGDAYDESHYKVTISGKKNVQAAIQALVGDNGDYGAVVLQDEGGSIRIMLNPKSVDIEGVTTLAQAQAANEQLKQGIEERNRQAIAAWEARTGLKYDPEWREHVLRPDGPFRERTGSYIREGTIRNGEWNGEVREYRDGVLRKTAIYKNGSETGTRKLYRGDGTLALDRFFNEDGNAVEIHYGKDGKTEEYRLVLGKRKVLFDSRNEQKTDPQEEVEPEAKPTDSWEGKTIEAIVQDIRAIRETPRADHTSPLLKPGATQQKDGTVLHVEPENGSRDVRVYRTNKNGKKVGEEKAFRRIWNDAVTGKPEFDDFLTLYESTRYDDNGNPVEILSYDPDGRIHGRERFRSWRDDNGEWHTKSVDSFVVDEDGVYIGREGKTTDVLPLDVLGESRGQTANTAQEERPATALEADEALNWAGERFRNRRAAEAIAQDTALPETGAEGTSDLDGLSANTALSVGGFGLNANARAEMEKVRKQYEGTDKWMKAPNGKPTKLTRRLWLLVRTPAFKRWFGDWENDPANASKVVDENGEPLVVYHGSENAGFTTFDSDYWDEGMLGNFASSEEFVASTYSGVGIFKGDPDTPLVRGPALNSEDEPDSRPGNYALFLNIRKPLVVDAQGHNWNDIPAEGKDDYVEASDLTDEQLLSLKEDAWPPIDIELEYDEDGNLERWSHLELAEVIEENYVQEELDEDENVVGYSTPLFHKDTLETTTARQLTQSTRDISNWALRDDTGWDGVIFRNVIDMGQYSDGGRIRKASDVFVTKEGPQLKSAVRNTGNFNPENPDIRLSVGERMGGRAPTVEPGGDVREAGEGALAWLRRKFVHSQTPVFDAVRRVMGVGREPPDALNVEAAAKNVHGKIRARQEMLQRAYLEPLKAILAQPGMDRKRFDDYALALHALERNRMIQERSVVVDPTSGEVVDLGVEAGSGVTNAWAERVIREIQRDPFAQQYKEAANILAEMNRFVLRGAVADGLLTEAQAATWMRLSPHYVPLKSGGAAPGAIHKRATGRFTRPDSVLVNSMRQAYATVRNGELNRVNKTMADWIREYDPNGEKLGGTVPESHKHAKIKMTAPQYVPKGSTAEALLRERGIRLVETEDKGGYWVDTGVLPNALKRVVRESVPQGDDIVTFWENGERKFIRFEGKRGRDGTAENEAARIADALNFKNVLHKEGRFWDAIRGLTRWKANVSTSWNPTFIVRNMGADVFNTANLMMIEGKYAELARTMRNYPEALRTIARLHSLRREAGDSKMERMFMEAMQAGAFTGTYGLATFGDFENDLNTAIGEFSEMDAKNVLRKGTTQVTRALRKLGNAIDKVGAVPEMGMRLAVYTALRDSGWSQAQAAQYAREITVDFNAKGEWTPFFNTLYMFSNAAIQSFARYMKAFAKTRDEKGTARALGNLSVPIALNILIGYLAASALGDDDDDEGNGGLGPDGKAGSTLENLNDYELENNLHIKIGNGITLRLPTRGTMAPFVYLGQKLAKYQRGLETEEEFLTDVATSMVQANLNFMGQSPTIGQQLAPTVADPLVQWLEGKDWAGRDLFRRDYGQAGSDAHQGFERTPWIYRSAVQALNELTGGDEVQSGAIDWRPESLKLFTDFILGSISQNVGSIANLADKLGGDESVETGVNDIPFVGGIVRETPDHTSRYYREFDRFDTLRKEMAMYESLAKNARTAGERQAYFAKADAMLAEYPELRFAKGLKRLSDNITDIRKTIREEEARPTEERNQAFIDFLEQQNLELMAEFLRAIRR